MNRSSNADELVNQLRSAATGAGAAVFRSEIALQPASGWSNPTLRAAVYSDGAKTYSGKESPGPVINGIKSGDTEVQLALIQSVEARAHRISEALRGLVDLGVPMPLIELYREHRPGSDDWVDPLVDSFSANHHVADAAWREALDPGADDTASEPWPRFWSPGSRGAQLNPLKAIAPADLLRLYPSALLHGYDPRGALLSAKDGKAARGKGDPNDDSRSRPTGRPWGRVCRSEIVAEIDGIVYRTQSLVRNRPARLDAKIYQTADGGWTPDPDEAIKEGGKPKLYPIKKGEAGRPSIVGLDNVTPSLRTVPDVWARRVTLSSYLSLTGLRHLKFSDDPETDAAARTLVAALGVAGLVLAEKDLRIRSDCDLVPDFEREDAPVRRMFLGRDGRTNVDLTEEVVVGAVRMAEGKPPEAVSAPTGMGKTGILACWVWALAQCSPGPGRPVPMRMLHVSPRRVIVDDASRLADRIVARLDDPDGAPDAESREAARWVAERLSAFTAGEGPPLVSARLRGGIRPDISWRGRVDQPAIIVSTADLAGSALLFRHWLASARTRPIFAALVGEDACWVVDEAHLQAPLVSTVRRSREAAQQALGLPWWLIEATATPSTAGESTIAAGPADAAHPVGKERLAVVREVVIHDNVDDQQQPEALADAAVAASDGGARAVLTVANEVRVAREVRGLIAGRAPASEEAGRVLLIHGQQRESDRTALLELAREAFGMGAGPSEGPAWYLVATSAIEVGADLSADHLVSAACPIDALLQRLGRLGRRADRKVYRCDLVPLTVPPKKEEAHRASPDKSRSNKEPGYWVRYKAASEATVARLKEIGEPDEAGRPVARLTAGPDDRLAGDELRAPRPDPAPLYGSGLRALVQTRPTPIDTPDVDTLIHGLQDSQGATVYLAWRADLDPSRSDEWVETVERWPIRPHEVLPVSLKGLSKWPLRDYVRWDNGARAVVCSGGSPMTPGSVVVVPAAYGGHDTFGFNPSAKDPAKDVADQITDHPRGPRLRLLRELLGDKASVIEEVRELAGDDEVPDEDVAECLSACLSELGTATALKLLEELEEQPPDESKEQYLEWTLVDGGLLVTVRRRDLDDEYLSLTKPVTLDDHQADVADRALGMAQRAGVPPDLAEAVRAGALLHDCGKALTSLQLAYGRGKFPAVPLAKSGLPQRIWYQLTSRMGVPAGYRHEAVSAALATVLAGDVASHLAGASHGYCRPWFNPEPGSVDEVVVGALDGVDAKVRANPYQDGVSDELATRFFALNEFLGPWGLAWLEAAVRLADQAVSALPRFGVPAPRAVGQQRPVGEPLRHAPQKVVRLQAIHHTSVAGWLATLGAFSLYAGAGYRPMLRWTEGGGVGPVPELLGPLGEEELAKLLAAAASEFVLPASDSVAWDKIKVSGSVAVDLAGREPPRLVQSGRSNISELYCNAGSDVVHITQLLCGLSGNMRPRTIATALAKLATTDDVSAVLFEHWNPMRPKTGKQEDALQSLGLDRMTVADGSRGDGVPRALPARDWLALHGAAWLPRLATSDRLVWPIWAESLGPDAVAVLATRPELLDAVEAKSPKRSRAARKLSCWSVNQVMVSRAVRRVQNDSSAYQVWEEAASFPIGQA